MSYNAAELEAGVSTLMHVQANWQGAEYCALGYHAWVPWLGLENGSYLTWCARGCGHKEQYDPQ